MGYFDCIDSVMENSKVHSESSHFLSYFPACSVGIVKDTDWRLISCVCVSQCGFGVQVLGEAMAGISHNAKNSNLPEFGDAVSSASKALCGLTEAATQVNRYHWVLACLFLSFLVLVCCNQHIWEVCYFPWWFIPHFFNLIRLVWSEVWQSHGISHIWI